MKKYYKRFITPTILLVVTLFLFIFSLINLCASCKGWSTVNPLCWLGYAWCVINQELMHIVMRFGSFILFVVVMLLYVRAGLKK